MTPSPAPTDSAPAQETILAVDDTPANLSLLAALLGKRYRVQLAPSGAKALELARRAPPDLVVLDVMMPEMDGYEVCRRLKADPVTADVPVLFLTALSRPEDETRGFEVGGADFVHKPFNAMTVLARVRTQLDLKAWRDAMRDRHAWLQRELDARLAEVERLRESALFTMISFSEFRDHETGNHVRRTREYVRVLAQWLAVHAADAAYRLEPDEIEQIARSAPLHDVGKVAIPDSILLHTGPLGPPAFEVMKTHAMKGWEMLGRIETELGPDGTRLLRHARDIARWHHERWDGTGYPDGLAGNAIPLSARLMAVADVYDALISRRPYKEPFPHARALDMIRAGSGGHFDPVIVEALLACHARLDAIALQWQD
ncbi:HD domain-containing phosphohydrolase [Derxia gummosa]|uniref:HD domain-containing phosphohydrolase n=1 Tax=Derxia gummosa DSM 723 TaxID=1121388 RepID=A0A8B6XA56_9BURK|nr:HD domain-containing phosphohydrolase [Derxia gummosa]